MPCALTPSFTCASPTVRRPLHSSTHSAHGHCARSHLGGNFDSRPSSQRTSRLPSSSKARAVGLGCGFFGWILSSSPIPLVVTHLLWEGDAPLLGHLRRA